MALGQDNKDSYVKLWSASLVVAILFLLVSAIGLVYDYEESEIRRESYVANLQQFYQQEVVQCGGNDACIAEVNEDNRYAQLLKRWGGEELLVQVEVPEESDDDAEAEGEGEEATEGEASTDEAPQF